MHDLQLVGFTTDRRGLIFRTTAGARPESYVVPITDELVALVRSMADTDPDEGAPGAPAGEPEAGAQRASAGAPRLEPRAESQLSVREIQARLRAGEDVARVAREAGVDDAWIERFAPPVRAEQRRIVERALDSHLERPRAGASVVPLRGAVGMALADKGIAFTAAAFDAAWSSRLIGHDRWAVQFRYRHRGKERTAVWDFDATDGSLTTTDRAASQLGFVGADGRHDPAGAVIDGVIGDPDATPIGTAPPPPRRRTTAPRQPERTPGDGDASGAAPAPAKATSRKAGPTKASGKRPATKTSGTKKPAAKKPSATKAKAPTTAKKAAPAPAKKAAAAPVKKTAAAPVKKAAAAPAKKAAAAKAAPAPTAATEPPPTRPAATPAAAASPAPTTSPAPTSSPSRSTSPAGPARPTTDAPASNGATRSTAGRGPVSPAPERPSSNGSPTAAGPVDRATATDASAHRPPVPAAASPVPDARRRTVQVETRRGAVGSTPPVPADGEAANPDELLRVRARRVEERLSQQARTATGASSESAVSGSPFGDAGTDMPTVPRPWTIDAVPEADRTAARRARAAERNAHTVQFRSGAAAPVRVAGEATPTSAVGPASVAPPPAAPRPASADGTSEPPSPPVDANGAARPRTRRRRQLRAR